MLFLLPPLVVGLTVEIVCSSQRLIFAGSTNGHIILSFTRFNFLPLALLCLAFVVHT